jgi:hypothetical protein
MTIYVYPLSGQETSEAEYESLMSAIIGSGTIGQPGSTALAVSCDGTDRIVLINEGTAICNGHFYQQSGYEAVVLDVGSSQPRYDRIVLRLNASTNSILPTVIKGTPGSSPTIPAMTQSDTSPSDFPIAVVYVPANAQTITGSNLSDARVWLKRKVARNTNAVKTTPAIPGDLAVNVDGGQLEWYNNGTWQAITPQIDASRIISGVLDPARLPLQNINNLIDIPDGLGTYGNWSPVWNKTTEVWDWDPNYRVKFGFTSPYSLTGHGTPAVYPSYTQVSNTNFWAGATPPAISGQLANVTVDFACIVRAAQPVSNTLPAGYYVKLEIFHNSVLVGLSIEYVRSISQNGTWDIPITISADAYGLDTSVRSMYAKLSFCKTDSAGDGSARLASIDGYVVTTFQKVTV